MSFHNIIQILKYPLRADHEFSQHHPDSGRVTEGRSIGRVRDKSAPTVWITNIVQRWLDDFIHLHNRRGAR